MNVGSLFTGIGGFDLGLARAGMHVCFQAESDEWRRRVLAARFPGVPCYADVCEIAPASAAACDLLCGGFPCQDLSVAGRRAGLGGERSGLFFEFARIADDAVRPGGFVLIENVPGLFSSHGGRDFAVLLATLAKLGFHDLAWRVLDSRYFGVPQGRRRVFILGRRARGRRCCEVLLEPESGGGDFDAGNGARADVSAASLSGLGSGGADDNDGQAGRIVTALTTRSGNTQDDHQSRQLIPIVGLAENQRGEIVESEYAHTLPSGGGKPGRGYAAVRVDATVRRLTPRECERLQGFPDDWTALGPDGRRYAALGDAVTVPVAEWIGRRVMAA